MLLEPFLPSSPLLSPLHIAHASLDSVPELRPFSLRYAVLKAINLCVMYSNLAYSYLCLGLTHLDNY